ncbi:MAG: type II methionyl aminopeptidase [Candidatus Micrarchaeaceae archaeon]
MEIGEATKRISGFAKELVREGASVKEIAEKIEKEIRDSGFLPSFPVNISINSIAAHSTPSINDASRLGKDVVKVDLGLRKGKDITDVAFTVDLSGEHGKIVDACNEALNAALSKAKAGVEVREIGKEVEEIAKKYGLEAIRNLGGHGIKEGELHADIFIPNFDNGDTTKLKEGEVVAIETFITNGEGYVLEGDNVEIFRIKEYNAKVRNAKARDILNFSKEHFSTYPFSLRWISKLGDEFAIRAGLRELIIADSAEQYPVLIERKKGIVAQAESTLLIEKDSCKIIA